MTASGGISWDFVISVIASPLDAFPRILWSHSLYHHLMHLLGFYDLTHCITIHITTRCISWDFMILLIASSSSSPLDASPGILWSHSLHHHLHHHLMHLLGFCDLTHCITTWCISWVFVISLTTSPPDAFPKFLWSHWLHHHLIYLPVCGDVITP